MGLLQGLVQYGLAKPLFDQLYQAPDSIARPYKAVVIAMTCVAGCLLLLCLIMASMSQHYRDSFAGSSRLPQHELQLG